MREKTNIFKSLNIEATEITPVLLLITQSIFLGIFYGTFDIGAHTLFLKTFPESMIPKAYIISGIVGILMTSTFSKFQSKIKFSNLASYTFLFITLLTILVRILFEFSAAKWTVFIVFILLGPLNILAILSFWGTAGRIFSLRQGKRLYGIIDSGQVFGIIISSYAIPLIIAYLNGTKNLLVISAGSIVAAMLIEIIISRRFQLDATQESSPDDKEKHLQEQVKLRDFLKNPYITYMALFVIFSMFTAFFVQYSFLVVTNEQYKVEEDLAKYLGFFTGSMMIFTFIIKTFVYSKLMKTYGLKISLLLSSLLLIVFTGIAILIGFISGYELEATGFIYFFLFISLSKLFNKTLKDALEVPSFKLLYQSLKKSIRFDVQAKIDGTINEIAALISGILLSTLGLLAFIKLIHFSVFLFGLLLVWAYITFKLYREYRKSLEEALQQDSPDELQESYEIQAIDHTNIELLNSKLDYTKSYSPYHYHAHLALLSDSLSTDSFQKISKEHRIGIYLQHLQNKTKDSWDQVFKIWETHQAVYSIKELSQLLKSADPAHYVSAIKFIWNQEAKTQINMLWALLRIPDNKVQCIAIQLSGALNETETSNTLVEFTETETLFPDAFLALGQMAEKNFPFLLKVFYKTDIKLISQLAIIDIVSGIEHPEITSFLLENISHHKKDIREKAIEGLLKLNFTASEKDYPKLFHAITTASYNVSWDIAALASLADIPDYEVLSKSLEFEHYNHQNSLFKLLALTYDAQSVWHVKDHLTGGSAEGVGYALELFDLFISEEIKPMILSVFEDLPYIEKVKLLENFFPVEISEPEKLLLHLLNRDPNLISLTTKKIALNLYAKKY
ncbi:MAG: hypothetical protein M0P66_03780, partial [Salinivirgaceae bacterium]|nr:hypothetical protein [Salinivirgaceae bacterium]